MLLRDGIVGIADDPLSPYALPCAASTARAVAWACEEGLGDAVAWATILTEKTTTSLDHKGREVLHLSSVLAAFRAVHGNRKTKRRKTHKPGPGAASGKWRHPVPKPEPTLFDV